jgi:hypothetical protein
MLIDNKRQSALSYSREPRSQDDCRCLPLQNRNARNVQSRNIRFYAERDARWTRRRAKTTRATSCWVLLVKLLNLLLYLAAKFEGMRDFVKWIGRPARADQHNRSVVQHSTESRLGHFDALHFV